MTNDNDPRPASSGYQIFMLVLCLYALGAMAAQTAIHLEPGTLDIIEYADYAVCALFLIDFAISLWRAPNRQMYFLTWGWLDLISSIPAIEMARWGRAARVLRVLRVFRGLRATKLLTTLALQRRTENTFLAVSLVALLLTVFCSIAILHFESGPESNIKTPEDALWWAFATITTVGYGDRYPVTLEGRLVAAVLMCGGVGLFGTFSGFLAAWLIGPNREKGDITDEVRALRQEVATLTRLLGERCRVERSIEQKVQSPEPQS